MNDIRIQEIAERTNNRHAKALLMLLFEQGWTFERTGESSASFAHPRHGEEVPTPDYVPASWWGEPIYWRVRKLRVVESGGRFALITKWTGPPWAGVDQGTLTYKAAMEYVRAPLA